MIGRVDSCYLTRALFASAMAATLNGRRARSSVSHGYFLRVLLGPPQHGMRSDHKNTPHDR
jgi:hypothetical protein